MITDAHDHSWRRVRDDDVWQSTKIIFLGSLLVFLINITLGFLNIVTPGEIPEWQILTHLHGGTLGWLTLSAIGFTVWIFTGNRTVSDTYRRRIRWLAWAAVILGAGYVSSFGIGFALMGNAFALLPVFGTGMMLVIWATALIALGQLRSQPVVRTVHLLVAAAWTVASFGAIMGVLLGLQHALGSLPLPGNLPNTSAHAGPMDTYALIMGAALIEWLVIREEVSGWTWPGMLQAVVWGAAGLLSFVGGVLGLMSFAAIGGIGAFVLGPLIFFGRIGWRAALTNPITAREDAWALFAPLWLVVFVVIFVGTFLGPIPRDIEWLFPVAFHAYFVGYLTNSLFGMLSGRTRDGRDLADWAEPAAMWGINLGLIAFAATEIAYGGRHGAILMGLGVLLAVATMGYRLLADRPAGPGAIGSA